MAPSPYLCGNPTLQNEISQISGTASNGNQSYNALQAVLLKRLRQWVGILGRLHLFEVHDGLERLLRVVGRPDHADVALLAEPI